MAEVQLNTEMKSKRVLYKGEESPRINKERDPFDLDEESENNMFVGEIDWDKPQIHPIEIAIKDQDQKDSNNFSSAIDNESYRIAVNNRIKTPIGISGETSGIKEYFSNPRLWFVLLGVLVIGIAAIVAMSSDNKKNTSSSSGEPSTPLDSSTPTPVKADNQESLSSVGSPPSSPTYEGNSTIGMTKTTKDPDVTRGQNTVSIMNTPTPPLVMRNSPEPISMQIARRQISGEFTINTRAGDEAIAFKERQQQEVLTAKANALSNQMNAEQNEQPVVSADLVKGQRILLYTMEPFRTGVATVIQAQVLNDVRDKAGKVIFPIGTIAIIPMAAIDANGRAIMAPDGMVTFRTKKGEYGAVGELKGTDGFVGLKGKMKKIGGRSGIRRVVGGAINVATGAITRGAAGSGVGNDVAGTVRDEGYELNSQVVYSDRVVEIPLGINCTLIVR